jgi:hypothetical protein
MPTRSTAVESCASQRDKIAMSDTTILAAPPRIALCAIRTDQTGNETRLVESRMCDRVRKSGLTPRVKHYTRPIPPHQLLADIEEAHAITVVGSSVAAIGATAAVAARKVVDVWLMASNDAYRRCTQGGW